MAVYRKCPKYGEKECCSLNIDAFIAHVEGFSVNLTFKNKETINIHPWMISEVIDGGDRWTAIRQNTPEYEAIDTTTLTQKSRILFGKHHHWGKMTYMKGKHCPLK
ncbi:MAG: hypothetical protein UR63_C0026G0007 [Candidatus Roizmanbacteria bacterium GW2011_GWC2_35_12]|uniref:Uncharacterized protein n=2 Tax=Candidatus Roizmaniibacteriota TaxID=1752723 RepID=A0A0G0BC32_9BACT|nr:MAG: hypothetical protein UR63_C0026G0007 [Candidatus Roizmanbacteria bacterium GW2011_GWC2_35_12]